MHATRTSVRCGLFAVGLGVLVAGSLIARAEPAEYEQNGWPVVVRQLDEHGEVTQWTAAGPLLFGRMSPDADGGTVGGLRPLWIERSDRAGKVRAGHLLYPLFNYRGDDETYQWNILQLVRRTGRRSGAPAAQSELARGGEFEVWPFWFSRQTGDPELSYRALFPIAGTVKNKLGFERASWVLFPLYAQTEKRGAVTTAVPWPIVRVTRGTAEGFGLWPLFEFRDAPGRWKTRYFLWPLGYNNTTYPAPDAAAGTAPRRAIGALPLYARHTGPGYRDESFVWPFFGYTDRTQPTRYHETRYFWPLLVQGRGEGRYVNRWGPVYTHSVIKGYDKTWYVWPLVRRAEWQDEAVARSRTQVLYFLYWSEQQRSASNRTSPAASLTHLWPLYSGWDNGAGQRQVQVLSPFEVFFPGNEKVRAAWSPLFALARYEQTAPGESRTSLLWNAVTWRRSDARQQREFHLGPLLSVASDAAGKRIAVGNGLIALEREPGAGWKLRWLDFRPKPATTAKPSR